MKRNIAIIDLGSNSARLVILSLDDKNAYKMLDQAKIAVRLSEGMEEDMMLQDEPMNRTVKAIKLFKSLYSSFNVREEDVYPIATAALRMAKNADVLQERLAEVIGRPFDVISGNREAYLDYLGVVNTIDISECLIIDIGGGSTELVLVKNREVKEAISLPFGSVILSERFKKGVKINRKAIESFIEAELDKVTWLKEAMKMEIVGLGGAIRTLAKVDRYHLGFQLNTIHNYRIDRKSAIGMCEKIFNSSPKEAAEIRGISDARSDIISGGLYPLYMIMKRFKSKQLIISGNGLREGLFFDAYYSKMNSGNVLVDDVLEHSLDNIMKIHNVKEFHAMSVNRIALKLFDGLKDVYSRDENHRKLVMIAGILHDIGVKVDYYNHHRHGFYMIQNMRLSGLTNRELLIVAFLVGKHRTASLKYSWKDYDKVLDKNDGKLIEELSLYVRLGEYMDRSESGNVKDLRIFNDKKEVIVEMLSENDLSLELEAARLMTLDFKKVFGKNLVLKQGED